MVVLIHMVACVAQLETRVDISLTKDLKRVFAKTKTLFFKEWL